MNSKPQISDCAYIVLVMGLYWATEALPLTATALIPLFAFPLLQIQTATVVANAYIKDISFLFIGGLMLGIAFEEVNLHRRIALRILLFVGDEPRWLLAGIMMTTAFLSMWISNTATTSMMVPVVLSLARELIRTERSERSRATSVVVPVPDTMAMAQINAFGPNSHNIQITRENNQQPEIEVEISRKTLSKHELNLCKAMLLGVCYSASLGGTATLTGTPPNIVMTGLLTAKYGNEHPINFASWMGYNCPGMIINMGSSVNYDIF